MMIIMRNVLGYLKIYMAKLRVSADWALLPLISVLWPWGRFEGFWEFGLQPWDVCAGAIILQEAGGKVSDWDGSPMPFSGTRVLATNGHIHGEMIDVLREVLF